jgi:disulfide bond formation protein DsbB
MGSRRTGYLLGFLACVGLLAYALYAQFAQGYEPCPLCIFQRIGVAAIGVAFLVAALHAPAGRGAALFYGGLIGIAALATVGVAARHLYIQWLPDGAVPACGASLDYLYKVFPVVDVIRKVLTGSGECHKVTWTLLGLSMPGWVALAAAALGAWGLRVSLRPGTWRR